MSRPNFAGLITAILLAVVLLPTSYGGAYFAMLEGAHAAYSGWPPRVKVVPVYRVEGKLVDAMFRPANQMDRWIRTDYWSEPRTHGGVI